MISGPKASQCNSNRRFRVEFAPFRSDSKELLRLKEAMSLLEQGDLEKSRRLQLEQEESARLQSERDGLEAELRELELETVRNGELKERQLRERMESEKRHELLLRLHFLPHFRI